MTLLGSFVFVCFLLFGYVKAENRLSWVNSADNCTLANLGEINEVNTQYEESWIGGYYDTTPWMKYLGCYNYIIFDGTRDDTEDMIHDLPNNYPSECLQKCSGYTYIALMNTTCTCRSSLQMLQKTEFENCNIYCPSEIYVEDGTLCGGFRNGNKYFDVYQLSNTTLESKFDDQNKLCTIQTRDTAKSVVVNTARCTELHDVLCYSPTGDHFYLPDKLTFAHASRKCKFYVNPDSDVSMTTNGTFWADIRRFYIRKWLTNTTDVKTIKEAMATQQNSRCLAARQSRGHVPTILPLPCNNILSFICTPIDLSAALNDTEFDDSSKPWIDADSLDKNTTADPELTTSTNDVTRDLWIDSFSDVFIIQICISFTLSVLVLSLAAFWFYIRHRSKQYTLVCANDAKMKKLGDIYYSIDNPEVNANNTFEGVIDTELSNYIEEPNIEPLGLVYEGSQEAITANPKRTTHIYADVKSILRTAKNDKNISSEEYSHLNHNTTTSTLKCDFISNEYGCQQNQSCSINQQEGNAEVYLQPWDNKSSKLNRVFSQVRKGVMKRGHQVRKSVQFLRASRKSKDIEGEPSPKHLHNSENESHDTSESVEIQTIRVNEDDKSMSRPRVGGSGSQRTSIKDRLGRMMSFKTFK